MYISFMQRGAKSDFKQKIFARFHQKEIKRSLKDYVT